jgi:hypothetical protein
MSTFRKIIFFINRLIDRIIFILVIKRQNNIGLFSDLIQKQLKRKGSILQLHISLINWFRASLCVIASVLKKPKN